MNGFSFEWPEENVDPSGGASKLYDQDPTDGETYIMYHGTTRVDAQKILSTGFRQSIDGMLGPGVYLSRDLKKASCYPKKTPIKDKAVLKVKVNVGKVKAIRYQPHPMQKTWHDHGYDTAWVPPNCGMVGSGMEEDCVWDPSRIEIIDLIKPIKLPVQPYYSSDYM